MLIAILNISTSFSIHPLNAIMKQEKQLKLFIPEGLTCKHPFTYFIECVPLKRLYHGCKWSDTRYGARNSSIFMTESGYQTSSEPLKELIKKYGLDSFRVLCIRHYVTEQEVRNAEEKHLKKVDARNNPRYINGSNGSKDFFHGCSHTDATKKKMSDSMNNKSPEEKAEIAQKLSAIHQNRSPEEKAEIAQKKKDAHQNRSPEEKAAIIQKRVGAHKNRSPEEKAEYAQKQRDANKGLRLYDKQGEKSRKFKKQPEDTTWVLRLTRKELKDLGYPFYDHPRRQSKRFQYPPKDPAWILREAFSISQLRL